MRTAVKGLGAGILALFAFGCGHRVDPGTSDDRAARHQRVEGAMADFYAADPSLKTLLSSAQAYVIFPKIVSAAIIVGGAHGDGEAYEKGELLGYADVSQGSIGAQLGGQGFAEIVIFQTHSAFVDFTQGTFEFDARATAVAAASGAATSADYRHGVIVFTLAQGGLMAQAAIGGQKFRYTPVAP